MEIMLQTVIIVFMLFLCSLCLFAVLVIARDMVAESMGKRKSDFAADTERKQEQVIKEVTVIKEVPVEREASPSEQAPPPAPVAPPAPAPVAEPEPEIAPMVEVIVEEEPVAEEPIFEEEPVFEPVEVAEEVEPEVVVDDENAVKFSKSQLTFDEKYAMLSTEVKGYFQAIARHALSKEGAKCTVSKNYQDYKIGATRLVRMSIKRGEIVCEFVFIDRDFKNYASQADLKIKPSATVIRVTEPAAVGVAKDGIDLVYNQMLEEREYKRQLAKEKRKARRMAQKGEVQPKNEEDA